ncbi:RDD family protein [Asticcacaulis sp. EMRT-3]|uniref:RDD family protein n=1 Tax=Asticcacaulis sp. EMRT-3 TaxID=3040349 RepID=UPI0024AF03D7|nr:RDD family protein [Asticcacaulis sp. EMRT-3]MDI7776506.1 RDD family protein [Asticcacaulis sp. EMRT-3]
MARKPKADKPKKLKRDLMADATGAVADHSLMEVISPEGVALPFVNASFGARIGAILIDFLIMIIAPIIVLIIWIILPFHEGFNVKHPHATAIFEMVMLFFFFFIRSGYFMVFEMGRHAATPGKRLLKLRVIAHDGGRLTPAAIFTRNALREVELYLPIRLIFVFMRHGSWFGWLAAVWALGLILLPIFNRQHARLGDFLAGTRVVHMPKAALSFDLADMGVDRTIGLVFTPEQLAYGEMELTVLEQVLRERKSAVMRAVAQRIKTRIDWQDAKNPEDVPSDEHFLRAYYGALRAHLENRLLQGRRRKDKHDPALA